jgi:hypothetical protein
MIKLLLNQYKIIKKEKDKNSSRKIKLLNSKKQNKIKYHKAEKILINHKLLSLR